MRRPIGESPEEAMEIIRELEHFMQRQAERVLILESRRLWGVLAEVF